MPISLARLRSLAFILRVKGRKRVTRVDLPLKMIIVIVLWLYERMCLRKHTLKSLEVMSHGMQWF